MTAKGIDTAAAGSYAHHATRARRSTAAFNAPLDVIAMAQFQIRHLFPRPGPGLKYSADLTQYGPY
jgi:hypothetical protein